MENFGVDAKYHVVVQVVEDGGNNVDVLNVAINAVLHLFKLIYSIIFNDIDLGYLPCSTMWLSHFVMG